MKKVDYTIKLELEELKYDVKFDSWRKKETTGADIAYDNDDAEDWLCREIDNAVADIEAEIPWAVCKDAQGKAQTDALDVVPDEWVIHLQFSPNWQGSIRAMNSMAHQYVVNMVLYKWYKSADLINQAMLQREEAVELLDRIYQMARNERVELNPWRL